MKWNKVETRENNIKAQPPPPPPHRSHLLYSTVNVAI